MVDVTFFINDQTVDDGSEPTMSILHLEMELVPKAGTTYIFSLEGRDTMTLVATEVQHTKNFDGTPFVIVKMVPREHYLLMKKVNQVLAEIFENLPPE